ncbi:Dehydrogenase [Pseudobythopirellula maris]|uniref:Dehydrogenase n=1 Tax=Pseudobythopirellula maris TaxID=2527991 RepID=A0A5C5ZT02_9BACT|nr:Gfo/Idh/MocA family oxidoreductase [Pseudobythopirellula maris]TWT90629.1 Dehydrogenase [Pseudobythopirellula maris]
MSNPTSNSEQPLRLLVIGAGKLGGYHANIASQLDGVELVAVADPSAEARAALAEKTGAEPVADYREAISRIDAAVVATPTVTHLDVAGELLAAGKHTLVEKPLAPSLAEADKLVRAARQAGVTLQVGHVERFNPALDAVREDLADPRFIQATRTSGYTFRSTDIGAVLDLMIHDIDLALDLAGSPVVGVEAMGFSVLGDHEDMVTAQLKFESGCVAQLTASRVSYELERRVQVFTDRAFVAVDLNTRKSTVVRPTDEVLERRFNVAALSSERKSELMAGLFDELLVRSESETPAVNAIEEEQKDFYAAIREGRSPRVSGEAGRDAVAVAERILECVEAHRWDGADAGRRGMFASPAAAVLPMGLPLEGERRRAG